MRRNACGPSPAGASTGRSTPRTRRALSRSSSSVIGSESSRRLVKLDRSDHRPLTLELGVDEPTTVESVVPEGQRAHARHIDAAVGAAHFVGHPHVSDPGDGVGRVARESRCRPTCERCCGRRRRPRGTPSPACKSHPVPTRRPRRRRIASGRRSARGPSGRRHRVRVPARQAAGQAAAAPSSAHTSGCRERRRAAPTFH